jgi:hypothetical protein
VPNTLKEAVNLALREYTERRRRTEARLLHFNNAQRWDEQGFWQQHSAEKDATSR